MSLPVDTLEPLVLADGTRIDPASGKVIKEKKPQQFIEIPAASVAQQIVAKTRRSAAELPLPPSNMNAVSLCLFYTLWGLSDNDIAITAGLTLAQVKTIKKLEQFQSLQQDILKSVLEHEANDIRGFFQQKAKLAAKKIVDIAEEDDGPLGFKASQDILDRAGHRPADVVEHRHTMENSLRIEYVKKDVIHDVPTIEAQFEVIEDGFSS